MNSRSATCDPRLLDLFLRNQLPSDFQTKVEAHLMVCPVCQGQLDGLAGGPRAWREVHQYLGGDGAAEFHRTLDQSAPRPALSEDLEFLTPSDKSGSLGRLGSYEILEVVGRGGTGIVLKAFDPALHRTVAIKVLAPEYAAHGASRKRFVREAQAAAAVSHEHVLAVYAVDADSTPPYLVMAFIPGQSLQQRIDRTGSLELKEILRIGMQIASGLAAAHAQGLVHRDIKPANIMLENGIERVRIADFGLARAVDDASVTQNGTVAGTPQYMAPEQARGEVVDQRADLFALGSTLYAMCTGNPPFRASGGLAVLRQVCDTEPTPVRALNPDVPGWLEGTIRKLHAKDPAERFQSAAEVAELLENCLAHVQQPDRQPLPPLANALARLAPNPSLRPRFQRWRPLRKPVAVILLAAVAYFALIGHAPRRHSAKETEAETVSAASLEEAGSATFEADFEGDTTRVRQQMEHLRQSLAATSANNGGSLELELEQTRQRAEALRRTLDSRSEPGSDPVATQLHDLRRRLQALEQDIGK